MIPFFKQSSSFWLTRLFYIRGIGALYILMGSILYFQGSALIGPKGLTPVKLLVEKMATQPEGLWPIFVKYPSLLFYFNSDLALASLSFVMICGGLLCLAGLANWPLLIVLWLMQLSLVNGAGRFWSFGWETMMLEMTWLGLLFVHPWRLNLLSTKNWVPSYLSLWPLLWMMFRLMLGAGLIKVRGDACWLDLTCMEYHYQTQPNPHFLSWFYHHLPNWFHRVEVAMTHFYELFVPFLFLLPYGPRVVGGVLIILFQMTLITTGNLAFLNWQTIILGFVAFDDKILSQLIFSKTREGWEKVKDLKASTFQQYCTLLVCLFILALSYKPISNMISPQQRMNQSYDGWHLVNSYGLFGSITKNRYEIIISGTDADTVDQNTQWKEYEFSCKPGRVDRRPCWITPYHLRLDWQMWFSAMRPKLQEPWLVELARQMLQNSDQLIELGIDNPFAEKQPPKFLKMDLYFYEFSDREDSSGQWWKRRFEKTYLPPISLKNFKK